MRRSVCPGWVKIGGLALGCKRPVCPSEPTCSGTASTEAMGSIPDMDWALALNDLVDARGFWFTFSKAAKRHA